MKTALVEALRTIRRFALLVALILSTSLPGAALAQFDMPQLEPGSEALARSWERETAARTPGTVPAPEVLRSQASEALAAYRLDDAITAFGLLLGLDRNDAGAWLGLAEAWVEKETWSNQALDSAYGAYRHSTTDKQRARALLLMARSLEYRGEGRQALQAMTESVSLVPSEESTNYRAQLFDIYGFRIWSVDPQTDRDEPRICAYFSQTLATTRDVEFKDFVRISPETPIETFARGSQLCIAGVSFGQRYEVEILQGLPAASGDVIERTDLFEVTVTDRPATVGFPSGAYILPQGGEGTAPLTTVNVSEVVLTLYRINDRNLVQEMMAGRLGWSIESWQTYDIAETSGSQVWTGRMNVSREENRSVVTGVPISEMLPAPEPGIYLLAARDASIPEEEAYWAQLGSQWLVVTDVGLVAYSGLDGMTLAARSLTTGLPVTGSKLTLVARNNTVLAEATTDEAGLARFDAGWLAADGGNRPAAIYAYGDGDFTFLDVSGGAFDLSDRGVSGRLEPGPIDAFLYPERGVYRPGETANVTALLRDSRAQAIAGVPLTLKVIRPDGIEAASLVAADDGGGGHAAAIALPATAYTGTWTVDAYTDPSGQIVGTTQFLVEDFVPSRIRLEAVSRAPILDPGGSIAIDVSAQYLYGAPADGLDGEGVVVLRTTAAPFEDYGDWRFGLVEDSASGDSLRLAMSTTDAEGRTVFEAPVPPMPDTTMPLVADLTVSVFDVGGRPVNEALTLPVRQSRGWIGVRPEFVGPVEENGRAGFSVIALDANGTRAAKMGLEWSLFAEEWDYQWYSSGGVWDYEVVVRDRLLDSGRIDIAAAGDAARLDFPVEWGHYRFEVFDRATGAATSVRFEAGWWVSPFANFTPDMLPVTLDRESYAAGDVVTVKVDPPFAGPVQVLVANDRIVASVEAIATDEGATVQIPVGEDWGAGAYVLATAFRPIGASERVHGPGRAVGVAWFGIDVTERTLTVAIDAPEVALPRGTIPVSLVVSDDQGRPATEAYVTLAAVDEGILQLTGFTSPEPTGHYFGRRALGLEMRDAYGRLIVSRGERGVVRTGGDALADQRSGLPERSSVVVSLYSGVVALDAEGRAIVPLEMPDFNGEVRLMAVAWNASALGEASRAMKVRDPVIAELSLPRFLAPGDQASLALSLRNLDGPAGRYAVGISSIGPVKVTAGGKAAAELAEGAESRSVVSVVADGIDAFVAAADPVAELMLTVTGPDGFVLERSFRLSVRPAQTYESVRTVSLLEPGATATLDASLYGAPGTASVTATFTTRPSFDIAGLLRELDGYPYGCLEQTTSTAAPLLHLSQVAEALGEDWRPDDLRRRVQYGIDRIMTMQTGDGSFGMWSVFDRSDPWLTAYAMDFLSRARDQGYRVSDRGYERGLRFLSNYVDYYEAREECAPAGAYALYVLARAGAADVGDIRYYADTCLPRYETPLPKAMLGAAAVAYGETSRADAAFSAASIVPAVFVGSWANYGSPLRDRAAVAALMAEAGRPEVDVLGQIDQAGEAFAQSRWHSTQEMGWLLRAASAVLENAEPMSLRLDEEVLVPRTEPLVVNRLRGETMPVSVTNLGSTTVHQVVNARRIPIEPQPAAADGYTLRRQIMDDQGRPIAPGQPIRQGDLVIVLLSGSVEIEGEHQSLVVDLLPAGLEIENPRLGDGRSLPGDLAGTLIEPRHVEMRDDRFVAAVDLGDDQRRFSVAYLARAVTPGTYTLPGAYVEDMYQPARRARTEVGQIVVQPR